MNPCISVIIPVYNMEKTLTACLDSVISQTLKNIEIICIDDGSVDKSPAILNEYAAKHHRFKIIRQPNEGSGAARNAGIACSKGRFLAFADSDDSYFDSNALESLYNLAVKNDAKICGGKLINAQNSEVYLFEKNYNCSLFENTFVEYADYQEEWGYQSFIFDSGLIKSKNLFFPDYRRYQDPPWFVRTMHEAGKFFSADVNVYVYKGGGAHIRWNEKKYYDYLCGVCDVVKFAAENNYRQLVTTRFKRLKSLPDILPQSRLNRKLKAKIDEILSAVDVTDYDPSIMYMRDWSDIYCPRHDKNNFFDKLRDFYIFGEWRN